MSQELLKIAYLGTTLTPRFVIYIVLLLFVLIMGLVTFRSQPRHNRLLVILLAFTFLSEWLGRVIALKYKVSHPAYHCLIPTLLILHTAIHWQIFPARSRPRLIMLLFTAIGLACIVFNSVFIQGIFKFPSYNLSILALLIVIYTLFGFYFMLQTPQQLPLHKQPVFWYYLGNLLFYTCTFFLFGLFMPFLTVLGRLPDWGYLCIWILNMVLYSLYFAALKAGAPKHEPR